MEEWRNRERGDMGMMKIKLKKLKAIALIENGGSEINLLGQRKQQLQD